MSTVSDGRRSRKASLYFEVLEDRLVLTAAGDVLDQAAYEAWRSQTFTIDSTSVSENADEVAFDSPIDVESFGDDVQAQVTPSGNLIGLTQLQQNYSYRGQGYSVVVIDTGIDYRDSALGGGFGSGYRVIAGYDFVNNDGDPLDDNGHGTHVAGIIGSSDSTYTGVAPNVNLIALKVLGASGSGSFGDVEDALQWVVSHQAQYNIVAVNMSLGAGNYASNPFSFLEDEFTSLANQGVFVAVASGNSFYDYGSAPGVGYPAISNNVVSVGAVWNGNYGSVSWGGGARDYSTAADRITSFTQRGSALDILAPGAMVTSTYLNNAFVSMAGTSMASPFIAGAAAIIRQAMDAYGVTTSNYRNYILNVMQNTGVSIVDGDDENDNVTNTGLTFRRLDILAAVQYIVNQSEPAPAPTTASLPFTDSFTRNDSRWVGSNWTTRQGDYRITSNQVAETTGATSLVTLNSSTVADITVQATINVTAGGSTSLVSRYASTNNGYMYVGGIYNLGGNQFAARIYGVNNGVWTLLSSANVSSGSGSLRFETYGTTLTLFLDNQIVANAIDSTLQTGLVGIYGSYGFTDNFSAQNVALDARVSTTIPYADDFNRADSRDVGTHWNQLSGEFVLSGAKAVATPAQMNVATLTTVNAADVSISAGIDISGTPGWGNGLVARKSGNNQYWAAIVLRGNSAALEIWKSVNGTSTSISSTNVSGMSGTLRFDLTGTTLTAFWNGQQVASVVDSSITSAGAVGMQAFHGSIDNFSALTTSSTPSTPTTNSLPFSDDFGRSNSSNLGSNWVQQQGQLTLSNGRATATPSVLSDSAVSGLTTTDVSLSATVDISGTPGWGNGLFARKTSTGLYWAAVVQRGSGAAIEIWRVANGTSTALASVAVSGTSGTLKFDVVGTNLTTFWNGQQLSSINDSTLTAAGEIGIRAFHGTVDNFSALTATAPSTPPSTPSNSLPFSDEFARANASNLGSNWVQQQGQLTLTNGKASATPGVLSDAAASGISATDVSVSAVVDITGTPGWGTGLFARKTSSGLYWAAVIQRGSSASVEIWRIANGASSPIAAQAVSGTAGTLRFDVVGTTLTTYWNGQQVSSVSDSTLTAAGDVGIRAFHGTIDGFSAQSPSQSTPPSSPSYQFTDNFNRTNASDLGSNWTQQSGQFTVSNSRANATPQLQSDAAVNGSNIADVSVTATIDVTGTPGWGTGIFARKSASGLYWAAIILRNGTPTLEIWRGSNGIWSAISSRSVSGTSGTLRFDVVGSTLTTYWNGQQAASITDSSVSGAGQVGIRAFYGTIDNFSATSAGSQSIETLSVNSTMQSPLQIVVPPNSMPLSFLTTTAMFMSTQQQTSVAETNRTDSPISAIQFRKLSTPTDAPAVHRNLSRFFRDNPSLNSVFQSDFEFSTFEINWQLASEVATLLQDSIPLEAALQMPSFFNDTIDIPTLRADESAAGNMRLTESIPAVGKT